MAVDNARVVDVVSVSEGAGEVLLDIADHLDWSHERAHLLMLEKKINAYLEFIESGQLIEAYPDACGKVPVIHIACYHPPTTAARAFFDDVRRIVEMEGVKLTYKHSHFNSPPQAI